jgi:hypothetical protein
MQQDPEISQGRRPKNAAEAEFFDGAAGAGWLLTKRGWPDFFLKRGEDVIAVEVKPADSRGLRREQARVLAALSEAGIPCGIWSPDGGLQRVSMGVRGLQFVVVEGELGTALDGLGGESEGNQEPRLVPIEGSEPATPAGATPAGATPAAPSQSETAKAIDAVWACYVAVMKPRHKEAAPDDRIVIRNALQVATVEELEVCIRECEKSDYHMKRGEHARRVGGKYNALSKILKPRPRREETQRSRIDWWLDRADSAGSAGFPSADPAIVGQRQVEVQRGHRSTDSETVKKAKDAEAWLAKHGIETVRRREDGYPTFRRIGTSE